MVSDYKTIYAQLHWISYALEQKVTAFASKTSEGHNEDSFKIFTINWQALNSEREQTRNYYQASTLSVHTVREEAFSLFPSSAQQLEQRKARTYFELAKTLFMLGRYKEAGSAFKRAAQLDGQYAKLYTSTKSMLTNMIHQYKQQKAYKEAHMLCQIAILFDHEDAAAYTEQGTLYLELGAYQEAGTCYKQAIKLNKHYAQEYSIRSKELLTKGKICCNEGKIEEADRVYRQLMQFNPNYSQVYVLQARALLHQGSLYIQEQSYEQALVMFKRAMFFYPADGLMYLEYASVFYQQARYKEALALLQDILYINPGCREVHALKGKVLEAQKEIEQARQIYRKASDSVTNSISPHQAK